jgi:putative ABC transport system permease protein
MLDYIEGDLMEVYTRALRKYSKKKADLLFVVTVLKLFRPGIIRSFAKQRNLNGIDMIKSYLITGWRNLWRSKLHSTLNIVGLTLGITCFLLVGLYVFDEMTFDQQHTKGDRIYRVVEHRSLRGETTVAAAAGYKLAEESKNAIPEVENTTRIQRIGRANLVDPVNPVPFQEDVVIADEHFLEIFDFPLAMGDRRTALKEPNSIIIDEDLAIRLFNKADVIGRNVKFSFMPGNLVVTGILKNSRDNSSFRFKSVLSESTMHGQEFFENTMKSDWASGNFQVYALLQPDANVDSVSAKMTRMVLNNFKPEEGTQLSYTLQPLKDIHLRSQGIYDGARNSNVEAIPQGNPLYISIFSIAAFFVLLISGINYTNLTTARASGRTKEIGVRKAIGAMRKNLVTQFLFESMMITAISFALAVLASNLILQPFNHFTNKQLSLGFGTDYRFWLTAIASIAIIGLLSGSYGALLLSGLKPSSLLKGLKIKNSRDHFVRRCLVVFQFTISVTMIVGTIVLFMQVRYLNNTDLGFNKDLMVVIDVNTGTARSSFRVIKEEMSKVAAVKDVSVTSRVPGEWKQFRMIKMRVDGNTMEPMVFYMIGADKDFMKTYEIKLLQGRNFETDNDSTSVILNETAAKMLGITEASNQVVDISARSEGSTFFPVFPDNDVPFKPRVIGIVKDFHFQSLRDKIQPLVLMHNLNPVHVIDYYSVRIDPHNIESTLAQLKAIMVKANQDDPFEYHFLDDQLALFYVEDERRQTLLGWAASTTILIACLGLFGLATYSIEQRVKEIGIRKVLGASVVGVVGLLSRDFIKLVLIANCIAIPLALWGVNRWLQEYAYHIEPAWWIFAAAAIVATGIAFVTISYQAFKSAVANPVDSLRME